MTTPLEGRPFLFFESLDCQGCQNHDIEVHKTTTSYGLLKKKKDYFYIANKNKFTCIYKGEQGKFCHFTYFTKPI